VVCDSPLGDGHIRLAGDLPGDGLHRGFQWNWTGFRWPRAWTALRTVRSGFGPGLEAGIGERKINYAADAKDD